LQQLFEPYNPDLWQFLKVPQHRQATNPIKLSIELAPAPDHRGLSRSITKRGLYEAFGILFSSSVSALFPRVGTDVTKVNGQRTVKG
jgi:hypothetical protein